MNKRKAIRILEEQKQKVLSSEYTNNEQWTFETASYIKDFFGFESTEYSWISQFKWYAKTLNIDEDTKQILKEKPKKAVHFLDNCKRTLKNKGLFKKPKRNIISDKTNFELVMILIGIIVFWFWIGYWAKEFEILSVLSRTKTSISILAF